MVIEEKGLEEGGVHSTCMVCLEDFIEGEEVTLLPCEGGHRFHPHCIGPWLEGHRTCPNCREKVQVGGL